MLPTDDSRPPAISRMRSTMRILAAALALASVGCVPGAAEPGAVIIVAIDTLRADHLGAYGYPRPTSPNLDRLAPRGRRLRQLLLVVHVTLPAFGSMFTGQLPSRHGAGVIIRRKTFRTAAPSS